LQKQAEDDVNSEIACISAWKEIVQWNLLIFNNHNDDDDDDGEQEEFNRRKRIFIA
jgi:hypothetical protein